MISLCGCEKTKSESAASIELIRPTERGSSSAAKSTDGGANQETSENESGISAASDKTEQSAAEPEANGEKTVLYTLDPENACAITFGANSVTVKGKSGDLVCGVLADYPPMNVETYFDGDGFTYILTPKIEKFAKSYGVFYLLDKNNYKNAVYLKLSQNGIEFPDVSAVAENNAEVSEFAAEISKPETAAYITMDGTSENIPKILGEIERLSDDICAGIDGDLAKLRAISRWVSENVYYDYPAHNNGIPPECLSLEYVLNNRSSVCGGYANMVSALCAAQGIRCLNVKGTGLSGGNCFAQGLTGEYHEWNIAETDGRRVIIDAGWNSLNVLRANGTFNEKPVCYKYFDIGEDIFALDHKADSAEYRDYFAILEE